MNDPHVEWLRYDFLALDDRHDFTQAAPWTGQLGDFVCQLEAAALNARPLSHHGSEAGARDALEPYLRSWELHSELEDSVRIRFRFSAAHVTDTRSTTDSSIRQIHVADETSVAVADEVSLKVEHKAFPAPANRPLANSLLLGELLQWLRDLREHRQRLLVPAYLILTRLEFEFGGRAEAARTLNVSNRVLSKLGELAERNDPSERRKVKGPVNPLTEGVGRWIHGGRPEARSTGGRYQRRHDPPVAQHGCSARPLVGRA